MHAEIEAVNLTVTYSDRGRPFTALENVSFRIGSGEFVSIIGSSGCGKSTLLSVLEGLLVPTSGQALASGRPITGPSPYRSVVFQQYSLFPWMTALGNVAFAIEQAHPGLRRKERLELGKRYLARVGLAGFEARYPKELSGGQQQRVAIARALAEDGQVLLMDEPFGAIDARNRAVLQDLLLELWEGGEREAGAAGASEAGAAGAAEATEERCGTETARGAGVIGRTEAVYTAKTASKDTTEAGTRKTVVFITHDLDEAILLSDRIILLEADAAAGIPGHIRQEFTVPFARPRRRLELLKSREYAEFRAQLSEIFFEDEERQVYRA